MAEREGLNEASLLLSSSPPLPLSKEAAAELLWHSESTKGGMIGGVLDNFKLLLEMLQE